jgi:hypothetical protein
MWATAGSVVMNKTFLNNYGAEFGIRFGVKITLSDGLLKNRSCTFLYESVI